MNVQNSLFVTSMHALATQELRDVAEHPEVEDLIAYRDRVLDEDRREPLQNHLALCGECAGLLLDLEHFEELELPDGLHLSAEQIAADRRALDTQLRQDEAGHGEVLKFRPPMPPAWAEAAVTRRRAASPVSFHLVAALLLATVGLSFWIIRLHHRLSGLSAPRPNVSVHTLLGAGAQQMRNLEFSENVLPSSAAADGVMLILASGELKRGSDYRLELISDKAEALWSHDGLRRDPAGRFTLEIPARFLSLGGGYLIRVHVLAEQQEELFEEYAFRLAAE